MRTGGITRNNSIHFVRKTQRLSALKQILRTFTFILYKVNVSWESTVWMSLSLSKLLDIRTNLPDSSSILQLPTPLQREQACYVRNRDNVGFCPIVHSPMHFRMWQSAEREVRNSLCFPLDGLTALLVASQTFSQITTRINIQTNLHLMFILMM
jgi:hypothetical protein